MIMHPCFTNLIFNFVYLHLFWLPRSVQEEESLLAQSKLTSAHCACSQVGCLGFQNLASNTRAKIPLVLKEKLESLLAHKISPKS